MSDIELYEAALREFETSRDEPLWLKARVECLGDDVKARYLYLKLRVEELSSTATPNNLFEIGNKGLQFVQFVKKGKFYIYGELGELIENRFCEILNIKKFDRALCDLYVSHDFILLSPSGKSMSGFGVAGLLLTGGAGAVGVLGYETGKAIGRFFENLQTAEPPEALRGFDDAVVISTRDLILEAYDYRNSFDLFGGDWETRIRIKGEAAFNGRRGDIRLVFSFGGKTYDGALMSKGNNKVPELAKILDIPVPPIRQETKAIW